MKKTTNLLLGLATLWPCAYMVLFFLFIFSTILFAPGSGTGTPIGFATIFALHLLTMLVIAALTVFYMVNIFKNDRVDKDKKVLWAIAIFLGNMIAMPIYWYLYFWKAQPALPLVAPGQLGAVDTTAWTNDARVRPAEQEQYAPPREPPDWR